jgi:outer membrane protein OmpA-like peptidoglycan-associated protein
MSITKKTFAPALLVIVSLLAACSSVPTSTSLLDQTRGDYMAAQNNPMVANYAPLEFKQAGEALEMANAAATKNERPEQVDKLAYLAKQKIATAQEVAKQKAAENDVAKAGMKTEQLRLEARTQQAENATRSAQQAKLEAQLAQQQAMTAQQQADASRAQADSANAQNAALQAQLDELAAKKTERGMVITLGDVLFGTDKAALTSDGQGTAHKLGKLLSENPQRSVLIEGFTDSTGGSEHNLALSQRRAESVRNSLLEMGIARDRIASRGYGAAYPVAGNDNAGNRQLNRRVEIVLSEDGSAIPARR